MTDTNHDVTDSLRAWREGQSSAPAAVIDLVYGELKRIALQRIGQLAPGGTLSPTELLHEALLLALDQPMQFENRAHLMAGMSLMIRSALVDHARTRRAQKRGGWAVHVTLNHAEVGAESMIGDLLTLEQALTGLEKLDPRCGRVMHLSYFAGLSRAEIASLLDVAVITVDRDLAFARSWVTRALRDGG